MERTIPPQPEAPRSVEEEQELKASMARHPAGKKRSVHECPTCGQNVSGALGTPMATL